MGKKNYYSFFSLVILVLLNLVLFEIDLVNIVLGPTPNQDLIVYEFIGVLDFLAIGPLLVLLQFHVFLIIKRTTTYEYYYLRLKSS